MKKISLFLAALFTFFYAHSQTLPIDFEGDISNADFINFDGGNATVVANPFPSGINTSSTVGYMVRDGGAIWAGSKIALSNNLDFSVMTKLSMKVYTTAPVGTIVKFKLEGADGSAEVDALTTTSGEWETLEWVFAGTPNTLNEVVFMFDFGTTGDGSINSTFYFDDVEQVLGPPAPVPVALPLDFEGGTVSTDFLNFSGANASIIPNPAIDGNNPSNTVCQVVRDGGEIWAGSSIFLAENLDLSTMWHLSMKIYTAAPVGTRIKLTLEGPNGQRDLDVLTTQSGTWETISWNFDGQTDVFDRMIIMFDFGKIGDGSAASTFFFDDLQQFVGPALPEPVPVSLPINFEENIVSTDFTNFFGAVSSVIPNPQMDAINPSATVGQFVRSGGQSWAQSKIILTEFMDYSTLSSISMKVYTDAPVGTLLKFKVESTETGAANERDAFTTVSGEWATYTWDFAGDPPVYNVITLMLGYGGIGDASPTSTYLFDDIEQVLGLPPAPMANMPVTFEDQVSTHYFLDFDGAGATVIENPQMNSINASDSVAVIVRNGGQPWAGSKLYVAENLDLSTSPIISMKVLTEAPIGTTVKLKLENDGGGSTEIDRFTTTTGAWETLNWDFSGQPNDFNSLVFMFDFGAVGDSSATSTFFFDDIIAQSISTSINPSQVIETISCFPNPAKDRLTFRSEQYLMEEISIYDLLGNKVLAITQNNSTITVNTSDWASGIYLARITTKAGDSTVKIMIE